MLSDPICALATPPGRAGLAVIRLSGRGGFEIVRRLLELGRPDDLPAARRATLAGFHGANGVVIDRGMVTLFPGPRSYTGEDLAELSCHGGLLVPAQLLGALQSFGARLAKPGEFTRRAVLNGKLDLVQAEAVGDLIDATAPAQGRAALHQLEGGLSRRIDTLRTELVDLLALLSYDIDFPEEDDGPLDRDRLLTGLERAAGAIQLLLATAPLGERLHDGALVVLAGRPNAGKSSLFNALLGRDRALVTEVPGTTRDTIEATVEVEGWPVRLADTAGLRESTDRIERLGIEVSRRYLAAADLVLLCVEGDRDLDSDERALLETGSALVVRTKADLDPTRRDLSVSVVTGEGLGELRALLSDQLFGRMGGGMAEEPMLTRERHRLALEAAASSLRDARPELDREGDPVLASHHVRRAVTALDELLGSVDVDEVLDRVFSRFCVGK